MVERNENPKAVDMRIFDEDEDEDEEDEDEEGASWKAPGDVEERESDPKAVDVRIVDDEESHNDEDEDDTSSKAPGDVEERKSEGGRHGEIAKHTEGDVHLLADVVVVK